MKRLQILLSLLFILLFFISENSLAQSCTNDRYVNNIFTTSRTTVQYGSDQNWLGGNENLDMDIYTPDNDTLTKRPIIIMAFGGSFLAGSKRQGELVDFCEAMAAKGYVTASIDYRLGFNLFSTNSATEAVYRATQDMKAAIRFIKANGTTYGVDTTKIWAGGNSAGGITAVHAAYVQESERAASPLLATTYSPDMGCGDCASNNLHDPPLSLTGFPHGVINLWGAIGDLSWIGAGDVPIISFHSAGDGTVIATNGSPYGFPIFPVLYGSSDIHDHMTSLGNNSVYHEFPGNTHEIWGNATDALFIQAEAAGFMYNEYRPAAPVIAGVNSTCPNVTETYSVPATLGSRYCWTVSGGTIVSTNTEDATIDVQWGSTGGTLQVAEITCNVYESPQSAVFNVNIATPNVPTALATTSVAPTSAQLTWTGAAAAYDVEYQIAGSGNWQQTTVTSNTFNVTGLQACTEYEYRVAAKCSTTSTNGSGFSAISTFTTPIDATQQPTALTDSYNTITTDLTLSWLGTFGLSYTIEYQEVGGIATTVSANNSPYIISGLQACTEYQYRIQAVCAASNTASGYTAWQSVIIPIDPNSTPNNLTANNLINGDVSLNWLGTLGATYEVEYQEIGGLLSTQVVNGANLNLSNLQPCAEYQFRVRSVCILDNTNSFWSTWETFSTPLTANETPTALTTTPNTANGDVTLNWTGASNLDHEIEYVPTSGGTPTTITTSGLTYTFTSADLQACTEYQFRVRAICVAASSNTPYTTYATVTTPIDPTAVPAALTATPNGSDMDISWLGTTGLDYEIEYQIQGGTPTSIITSNTTETLSNLDPCSTYEFRVRAICAASSTNTNYSALSTFNTPIDPAAIPSALTATPNGSDMDISWTGAGGLDYEIEYQLQGGTPTTITTSNTTETLTNLDACATYEFRVRAICAASSTNTNYSALTTFNTAIDPTDIPSNLAAVYNAFTGDINLSWTGTAGLDFEVTYVPVAGGTPTILNTANTSLSISGLNSCEEYEFQVKAVCVVSATSTAYSTASTFATPIDPASTPTSLAATYNTGTGDIDLSWTGTGSDYEVTYVPIAGGTPTTVNTSNTNLSINGLDGCTEYEYSVKSVCTVDGSSTTAATGTFASPIDVSQIPTNVVATPDNVNGTVDVTWTGDPSWTYEIVYQSQNSGNSITQTTTGNSFSITDAEGCSDYTVSIRAVCALSNTSTPYSTPQLFATDPVVLQVKVILEGPYIGGGLMRTDLRAEEILPAAQPYNIAPWNYAGTEAVANPGSLPINMVDWVLVEIRDASGQTIIDQVAAALLEDGSIVSIDGQTDGIKVCTTVNEAYQIIVRHRNHLDIMSGQTTTFAPITTYDFTTSMGQANGAGITNNPMVDLGGYFALFAGDCDGEGSVLVNDYNLYQGQSSAINLYVEGDVNLDSVVTVADFNLQQPNTAKNGVAEVRY